MLKVLGFAHPSFGKMYLIVTSIGLFPIMLGVFMAEQRRLKRHLAQAQVLNQQLDTHPTSPDDQPNPLPEAMLVQPIVQLVSESGRERLSVSLDQLRYVESVDNYVQVHWLDEGTAQKTVLRSTLKGIESALGQYPQLFRCHRAYLVNLSAVVHADGNARGYQLTLEGVNETIPVSRSLLSAFDARLKAQSHFPIRP
jgi:DNA-binding LytR/AlgR family response regulator